MIFTFICARIHENSEVNYRDIIQQETVILVNNQCVISKSSHFFNNY